MKVKTMYLTSMKPIFNPLATRGVTAPFPSFYFVMKVLRVLFPNLPA